MKKFFENPGLADKGPMNGVSEDVQKNKPQDEVGRIAYEISDSVEDLVRAHEEGLDALDIETREILLWLEDGMSVENQDAVGNIIEIASSLEGGLAGEVENDRAAALSCYVEGLTASVSRQREMLKPREANDMVDSLERILYSVQEDGKKELRRDVTQAEFKKAINVLSEIQARIAIRKMDLIRFSGDREVVAERCAQANVDLSEVAKLNPGFMSEDKNFDDRLQFIQGAYELQFTEGDGKIRREHRILNKMRRERAFSNRLIENSFSVLPESEDEVNWQ